MNTAVTAGSDPAQNRREILGSSGTLLERLPGMALTVFGLLIVIGVVFKVMTGDEREHTARNVLEFMKELKHAARRRPEETLFHAALKERSSWAVLTAALVVLNAAIFLFMLFGSGTPGDPKTLVDSPLACGAVQRRS